MTAKATANPTRMLSLIRQKIAALHQEETKICHGLSAGLSKILVDAQALEVDFGILTGGLLDVIARSKTDADQAELWRGSGQKFLKNHNQGERKKSMAKKNDPWKKGKG